MYNDQQSYASGPAYSHVSAPRTPLGYGRSPQTPYSQQSIHHPHSQSVYGRDPQTHYSRQGSQVHFNHGRNSLMPYNQQSIHQSRVQLRYARSPQTPHNQQIPVQPTSSSQMNVMQGPMGGFDWNQMRGADEDYKRHVADALVRAWTRGA